MCKDNEKSNFKIRYNHKDLLCLHLKITFMAFFEKIEVRYLFIVLFLAFLIGHFIVQRKNSIKLTLEFRLIFYSIVMVILWFSLPNTSYLVSFGYPNDVSDIESKEKLLKYLQDYNDAIVKTTKVLHYMILITTFWLISILFLVIKYLKIDKFVE